MHEPPPHSHGNKLDGQHASLGRRKALALRLLKEGRWRPNRLLRGGVSKPTEMSQGRGSGKGGGGLPQGGAVERL